MRPPACCGPYFLLHNVFTPRSAREIQLSITLPQVAANIFTTFKLATVTDNHASVSRVSRCCGLLFSKAAAVNLSFPEREGRREWPGGRDHSSPPPICWLRKHLHEHSFFMVCGTWGITKSFGFVDHAGDACTVNKTSHPASITGGVV